MRNKRKGTYAYRFSIVMAVYNVEAYLSEAVESLRAQSIGFEHVQVILVDDGSPDNSGALCDALAAESPENIVVVHKPNGGTASARNAGLAYVQGEYVNFMDPDDLLTPETLSAMYDFFTAHKDQMDVAVIPMHYFEGRQGGHLLNDKFKAGTRVADLWDEYTCMQLSTSSAFFTRAAAETMLFDSRLVFAEDAREVYKILARTARLGILCDGKYMYRRRMSENASTLQRGPSSRAWYIEYLRYFVLDTFDFYRETYGIVPRFVQYACMFDLQWRAKQADIPEGALTADEQSEFFALLREALQHIDDAILMAMKHIYVEHKYLFLTIKYGDCGMLSIGNRGHHLHFMDTSVLYLENLPVHLDFMTVEGNTLVLEGNHRHLPYTEGAVILYAMAGGQAIQATPCGKTMETFALGQPLLYSMPFVARIPLSLLSGGGRITFVCRENGQMIERRKLQLGMYMPMSAQAPKSYYRSGGLRYRLDGAGIEVAPCGRRLALRSELALDKALWGQGKEGKKAIVARWLAKVARVLSHKRHWLFADRSDMAGDNGEAMFAYMQAHPQKDIKTYFVIDSASPDFERLSAQYGRRVLPRFGWKHKTLCCMGALMACSQANGPDLNPMGDRRKYYADLLHDSRFAFLQHGITLNDLSGWINRHNKPLALFVAATRAEYNSIVNGDYGFGPDVVKLTGFPRYDLLTHAEERSVLIAPTWRRHLLGVYDQKLGLEPLLKGFPDTAYFHFFNDLLNDPRLLQAAAETGYRLRFLLHPNLSIAGAAKHFSHSPQVEFVPEGTPYRDLIAQSNLLVTDYSSLSFDFAYLQKPMIYCQFDAESFFGGAHTVKKGYFDYVRDGFGEVEETLEGTVDRIVAYMRDGCQMKEQYRRRVQETFAFTDKENCARVYAALRQVDG